MKDAKQKVLDGELLSSNEVQDLIWDCEVDLEEGENRRWSRTNVSVIEINGRYFSLEWEEGLTEYQENEYPEQTAVEVEKVEKQIVVTSWEIKEKK